MCVRRYPGTPVPSYTSCAASLTANQRGSAPAVDRPRRMLENRPAMLPMRSVRSRACRDGGYLGSDRLVGMAATHAGTHSTVSIARTGARGVVSVTVHRCRTHLRLRDARCGAALMGDTDARPEELWRARLGCSAISACAGAIMGALRLMRSSPRAVGRAVRAVLRRAMSDDFGGDDVRNVSAPSHPLHHLHVPRSRRWRRWCPRSSAQLGPPSATHMTRWPTPCTPP